MVIEVFPFFFIRIVSIIICHNGSVWHATYNYFMQKGKGEFVPVLN
jgi:hypothetical protein